MANDLNVLVDAVINMNDPKFINALQHISQICQEKADVLKNMESIQNSMNAAQNSIDRCNVKLKELIEE